MSALEVEFNNHICKAAVNRPQARNAVNFAVMDALEELLDRIETDNEIRCLVLTGAGSVAFISGGDLREFHTIKTADKARPASDPRLVCRTIPIIGTCGIIAQLKYYFPHEHESRSRYFEKDRRSSKRN